jgi:hypothetical protein
MTDNHNYDPKLPPAKAGEYIDRSVATLARWRCSGFGPRYIKLGLHKQAQILYRKSDLDEWLESHIRCSTSDPGIEATG